MVTNSEKNEKSLAEFMVIITLVGVMMSVFINYFIKQEERFSDAGFKALSQNFNTKVAAIHAQWMMDKQPNVVQLAAINDSKKQMINVNDKGWVDVKNTALVCEKIWQQVMESPLSLMKQTIAAIEVRNFSTELKVGSTSVCRYVLPSGTYFDYNRVNGRVSSVITANTAK